MSAENTDLLMHSFYHWPGQPLIAEMGMVNPEERNRFSFSMLEELPCSAAPMLTPVLLVRIHYLMGKGRTNLHPHLILKKPNMTTQRAKCWPICFI